MIDSVFLFLLLWTELVIFNRWLTATSISAAQWLESIFWFVSSRCDKGRNQTVPGAFSVVAVLPTKLCNTDSLLVYKLLSLCHGWYNCRVWNGGINISGTRLYQQAKVFVTASYRQFIVTAAGIHNATASCFLYGSAQKKTGGQGQQSRAFLLLQTQKSPKPQNFPSKTRCHPHNYQAISN